MGRGHVLRMTIEIPKESSDTNQKGKEKRPEGRPKRRRIDCPDEDLKPSGIYIHENTEGRQRTNNQRQRTMEGYHRIPVPNLFLNSQHILSKQVNFVLIPRRHL